MRTAGHEQVTHAYDPESGLEAVVAVHDTTLGPALGGTRLLSYPSEEAALADALRLSKAMTYKAAAADLDLGGGKAVILADPEDKDEALLEAYGRAVDGLGGRYITTEDVNTTVADMDAVAAETAYAVGTSEGLGDPSPVTAYGIHEGIRACRQWRTGDPSLEGVTVLVQGVGKVGHHLTEGLVEAGGSVKISDPDPEARERTMEAVDGDVTAVPVEEALTEPCDVFAPCAREYLGTGDPDRLAAAIPDLACDIVAGSANNALGTHEEAPAFARQMAEAGILYAPDYVINAGGLILTAHEWRDSAREAAYEDAERIGDRLLTLFERAAEDDCTPLAAANDYAERRLR